MGDYRNRILNVRTYLRDGLIIHAYEELGIILEMMETEYDKKIEKENS